MAVHKAKALLPGTTFLRYGYGRPFRETFSLFTVSYICSGWMGCAGISTVLSTRFSFLLLHSLLLPFEERPCLLSALFPNCQSPSDHRHSWAPVHDSNGVGYSNVGQSSTILVTKGWINRPIPTPNKKPPTSPGALMVFAVKLFVTSRPSNSSFRRSHQLSIGRSTPHSTIRQR